MIEEQSKKRSRYNSSQEAFIDDWYRVHHVDFERKLRQAIIDRIEDKD